MRSRLVSFDDNTYRFSIVMLLHFAVRLKEHLNMMLLQKSGEVNETLDIVHKLDP